MKINTKSRYTCSNSSMMVEILRIKDQDELGMTCHIQYFTLQGTFITVEWNVRLEFENIKHWVEV